MAETALVTGGCGFIGRHLVVLLRERGTRVRVLDLEAPAGPSEGVEYRQGSVTDPERVRAAMEGVDTVYHLASSAQLWARDEEAMVRTSEEGTRAVLETARQAQVSRFVHTSTEAILQSRQGPHANGPVDETVQPPEGAMCGPYCVAKLRAERQAIAAAREGDPVVVVNPSAPLGPGDSHMTPPTRMLLGFLNGSLPAYLETTLNLVDVRDVAQGHILAAERGRPGERYLLGHTNIKLSELLTLLHRLTGLPMPRHRVPFLLAYGTALLAEFRARYLTHRPPDASLTGVRLARWPLALDNTKARRELGWEPRPLEESLHEAIEWLASEGLLERQPEVAKDPTG